VKCTIRTIDAVHQIMCERRPDLDKCKKWFYTGQYSEKTCPLYASDPGSVGITGCVWSRWLTGSGKIRFHLRTFRGFHRKPGTKSRYFCRNSVCYCDHYSHRPLSGWKKAGTDRFCDRWRSYRFCGNFHCFIFPDGCFCTSHRRTYAGTCRSGGSDHQLCPHLRKRYFLHRCL